MRILIPAGFLLLPFLPLPPALAVPMYVLGAALAWAVVMEK